MKLFKTLRLLAIISISSCAIFSTNYACITGAMLEGYGYEYKSNTNKAEQENVEFKQNLQKVNEQKLEQKSKEFLSFILKNSQS